MVDHIWNSIEHWAIFFWKWVIAMSQWHLWKMTKAIFCTVLSIKTLLEVHFSWFEVCSSCYWDNFDVFSLWQRSLLGVTVTVTKWLFGMYGSKWSLPYLGFSRVFFCGSKLLVVVFWSVLTFQMGHMSQLWVILTSLWYLNCVHEDTDWFWQVIST